MAWSTRQLAELAGTTVKAVRHYHELGLLDQPERAANGYKRYGVEHLVVLLRIRRLAGFGLSLAQIADMERTGEPPAEALRLLDAELAEAVERLRRIRAELADILARRLPPELPAELAPVAGRLSHEDRSLALVMTRVYTPEAAEAYIELLRDIEPHPVDEVFMNLPADADERARRGAAEQMLPLVRGVLADYPALDRSGLPPADAARTGEVVTAMMRVLCNPAQLDVLKRVGDRLAEEREPPRGTWPDTRPAGADSREEDEEPAP
ncbi:MerR family transcriptional regulator [Nocardiopsis tropica]|uniref:MerR family transcriptional regulator n=1 Tax=Nocardiopsis tropica TaxID=109330 RepID=A0ABV1ZNE7_9ACTN|nr:MerR family DNA-binding transcriptional regulator [Nocardiopsis tropica]